MKTILLNKMYSGNYLETDGNIGHEVINLFKCDNGRNYIYLLSDGVMPANRNDTIGAVLLVRWIRNGMYEILAKAEDLDQVAHQRKDREALHKEQVAYLEKHDVFYGGVRLDGILKDNEYINERKQISGKDLEIQAYITFETKKLRKPKRTMYIYSHESGEKAETVGRYYLGDINFAKQSPRMYFDDKKAEARDKLYELINDESLWEPENTTKIIEPEKQLKATNGGFLEIIRKEYDELVFSNLLKHYFTINKLLFVKFCKEVLGVDVSENCTIAREHKNIDIFVCDADNAIIIENKIKSGINSIRHDVLGDEIQSQLNDYYKYVNEEHNEKQIKGFVFVPNYNRISLDGYSSAEHYTIIEYGRIYKFFSAHKDEFKDKYFDDFLWGLEKHSKEVDDHLFVEMRQRFAASIMRIKEKQVQLK